MRTFMLLLLAMLVGSALAEPRPAIHGVSSIRAGNYNSPSVVVKDPAAIVREMNQLRRKSWRRGEAKISCYSTVVFLKGEKRVAEFRVTPAAIVERPVERGQQGSYTLDLGEGDIPELSRTLAEAQPAKDCPAN